MKSNNQNSDIEKIVDLVDKSDVDNQCKNMKSVKLKEIAVALKANLIGDPEEEISGVNGIIEAGKGDISFLANDKYNKYLPLCRASAVIVNPGVTASEVNLLQIENPRLAFAKVIELMTSVSKGDQRVSEKAFVSATAQIGENCSIYPGAYIGENSKIARDTVVYPGVFIGNEVEIGEKCLIYANVSVNDGCKIGDRVILNHSCVIGSEGFGFERDGDRHYKIPQVGWVEIEDDVEVGALCVIDKGSIKGTVIGKGTKMDNLVHIAHNCQIGENNLFVAQAGVAGTVKTGDNVWFGGQTGCSEHISIAAGTKIFARGVVTKNIEQPGMYAGFPMRPLNEWQKAAAMFYKAEEQRKKISALEERINELEKKLEEK